jgi:hypothetical protein
LDKYIVRVTSSECIKNKELRFNTENDFATFFPINHYIFNEENKKELICFIMVNFMFNMLPYCCHSIRFKDNSIFVSILASVKLILKELIKYYNYKHIYPYIVQIIKPLIDIFNQKLSITQLQHLKNVSPTINKEGREILLKYNTLVDKIVEYLEFFCRDSKEKNRSILMTLPLFIKYQYQYTQEEEKEKKDREILKIQSYIETLSRDYSAEIPLLIKATIEEKRLQLISVIDKDMNILNLAATFNANKDNYYTDEELGTKVFDYLFDNLGYFIDDENKQIFYDKALHYHKNNNLIITVDDKYINSAHRDNYPKVPAKPNLRFVTIDENSWFQFEKK